MAEIFENMSKELQMELEKNYLKEVIDFIKAEIVSYINKRNMISESLLDYRKKILEEYKDDEDKIVEYFDHERFVEEETYKKIYRRLKEMTILQNSPYFGSVDFLDKELNENGKIYIGRFGFTRDEDYEPIVVDWRAPIASLFYKGKIGDVEYSSPEGNIPVEISNKRQYIIKNEELIGMFDSSIDVKDDILQMVLSKNAEEKLKDIIMTIQKEQDEIIRQPKEETVIVDGVAGSGKTTIALHRVAYLLYNHRKTLQDKVMILGPNSIFMEYISMVLPSLGETGVKQTTFKDFACEVLGIENLMDFRDYMEKISEEDKEFIEEIKYKNSLQYKQKLDNLIEELENKLFKIKTVKMSNKIVITEEEIKELFYKYYKYMPLFRRSKKIKRIIFSKIKDVRDEQVREINLKYSDSIKKLSKEQLELEGSFLELKRKISIREVVKKVIETKKQLNWLTNPKCEQIYEEINGQKQLNIDDLAPIMYLKIKLEGFKSNEEIRHIVIDEAQDYSLLQFAVIREFFNCNSMTIVGDKNQRLIPIDGEVPISTLQDFMPYLSFKYFNLYKSYRSTSQIMKYANKYLKNDNIIPMVREGKKVVEEKYINDKEFLDYLLTYIEDLQSRSYESIGIICNGLKESEKIFDLLKDKIYIKLLNEDDLIYKGGLVIIPSYFAKGMEFDAVIFIDNFSKAYNIDKVKYVMATRALHELIVLKNK